MKKTLLLLFLASASFAQAQNLVVHYTLDDVSATVGPMGDLLPYGSGTAANTDSLGATMTTGEHSAQFFHGAGYVTTSALSNVGWSGVALSYWYKSQSTYQGVTVQGAYLGFGSRIYTNGHVEATFDGSSAGSISSTVAINDGLWHHVLIQNNGTTTEIYIDGVLNNSGTETLYTMPSTNSLAKFYLGSHINDNANEKIYAKLDEIKVFDDVLSQAQIDALYAYAPCIVNIPDANFKAYLVGNSNINTNSDTEISCDEAAAFTGTIICSNLSITDLTGIEAFTSLDKLDCQNNTSLGTLNISNIPTLTELYCQNTSLTALDLSNNTQLIKLYCDNNDLTSLDVSNNTQLTHLSISQNFLNGFSMLSNTQLYDVKLDWNNITTVDVSNSPNLAFLSFVNCGATVVNLGSNAALNTINATNNFLTSINLSNKVNLINAQFYNNHLTTIDLTNCTSLYMLNVQQNNLTTLDLSTNVALQRLFCGTNQLTSLDVSMLPLVYELNCVTNSLTSLNVKNGNNTNSSVYDFWATDNANLFCITVDDPTYSTTTWTNVDAGVTYTTDCATWSEVNEEDVSILTVYPNPATDQFAIQTKDQISEVLIFDLSGSLVMTSRFSSVNISSLPVGLYTVQITTSKGIIYKKLIKK